MPSLDDLIEAAGQAPGVMLWRVTAVDEADPAP